MEVEFGGISAKHAATALAEGFRASIVPEDAHALLVKVTALGDLLVEIDTRYAHPHRHPGTRWGKLSGACGSEAGDRRPNISSRGSW